MTKKILIWVGAIVIILGLGMVYLNYRNRSLNAQGSADLEKNGLKVSVKYNRPSVRGRKIFGTEADGALLPYGKYWRLGANEATEVTLSADATVLGNNLKAGSYRVYAIPGEKTFQIIFNSELGKWGAFEPDHSLDVLKVDVESQKTVTPVELFTIDLYGIDADSTGVGAGIGMSCRWADWGIDVPFKKVN